MQPTHEFYLENQCACCHWYFFIIYLFWYTKILMVVKWVILTILTGMSFWQIASVNKYRFNWRYGQTLLNKAERKLFLFLFVVQFHRNPLSLPIMPSCSSAICVEGSCAVLSCACMQLCQLRAQPGGPLDEGGAAECHWGHTGKHMNLTYLFHCLIIENLMCKSHVHLNYGNGNDCVVQSCC